MSRFNLEHHPEHTEYKDHCENKIVVINMPKSSVSAIRHYCEEHYQLFFFDYKIPAHILKISHGILFFGQSEEAISSVKENFFGQTIHINSEELIHQLISQPLEFFDKHFGRERKVNPFQFKIIEGSIVKSKNVPQLGKGIVKSIRGDEALVNFPKAKEMDMKQEIICHKSILRVITHICEVSDEYDCRDFQ